MGRFTETLRDFGRFNDDPVHDALAAEGGELAIECGAAPDLVRTPQFGERRWGDGSSLGALVVGKAVES